MYIFTEYTLVYERRRPNDDKSNDPTYTPALTTSKIRQGSETGAHSEWGRENDNYEGNGKHSEIGFEGQCPSSPYLCFFLSLIVFFC
jgi:hypothetical protein